MSKNEDAWAWLWVFITFVVVPNLLFNPYINHLWKPPVPKPDNNCKTRNDLQACKVTLKGFERIDKGWIMYVEGNEPYQVYTSFKPRIGENKYLTIYVEKTEDWWTLRDWYVRDVLVQKHLHKIHKDPHLINKTIATQVIPTCASHLPHLI